MPWTLALALLASPPAWKPYDDTRAPPDADLRGAFRMSFGDNGQSCRLVTRADGGARIQRAVGRDATTGTLSAEETGAIKELARTLKFWALRDAEPGNVKDGAMYSLTIEMGKVYKEIKVHFDCPGGREFAEMDAVFDAMDKKKKVAKVDVPDCPQMQLIKRVRSACETAKTPAPGP
jgi:hypothetical protein